MMVNFKEIVMGESSVDGIEPFIKEFLDNRFDELKIIDVYLASSDFDKVKKITHTWKGFCEPYGFIYLAELTPQLDKALASQDTTLCLQLVRVIEDYLYAKKDFLAI